LFKKISDFILDTLFPIKCIGCEKEKEWICSTCFSKLNLQQEQTCPYCQRNITPHGETCFSCKRKNRLDGLFVAGYYHNELLQTAIHLYKYRFIQDLSFPLGKFLLKAVHFYEISLPDLIIPIPLHKYRQRWRGFNQSFLLAQFLSQNLLPHYSIPIKNVLKRIRFNKPQASLHNYLQREKNIEGIFQLEKNVSPHFIKNKKIWLIDDVVTTGSTLNEATKILKKAQAQSVWGIVLARQKTNNRS